MILTRANARDFFLYCIYPQLHGVTLFDIVFHVEQFGGFMDIVLTPDQAREVAICLSRLWRLEGYSSDSAVLDALRLVQPLEVAPPLHLGEKRT